MDIVERLLVFEGSDDLGNGDFSVCVTAADEITRLRAQAQHESDCAEAYKAEADRLRDENESLRGSLEEWRLDLNSLRDENAKLRADAERYRWIREYGGVNTMVRCDRMGSYIPKRHALDAAIDAAMQKGE